MKYNIQGLGSLSGYFTDRFQLFKSKISRYTGGDIAEFMGVASAPAALFVGAVANLALSLYGQNDTASMAVFYSYMLFLGQEAIAIGLLLKNTPYY